ncbi:MAG: ABC transporter permease, partial [Pseudoflavonifractor sp.]
MIKIMRYLKTSVVAVLAIIALLVVQAYCDLSLPTYTADIVDVGIAQEGIANVAPDLLRPMTFENLALMLSEEDGARFRAAYEENGDGNYALIARQKKELSALNESLKSPVLVLTLLRQNGMEETLQQAAAQEPQLPQALRDLGAQMVAGAGAEGEQTLKQAAIAFTKGEYEALGMDLHEVQTRYLLTTGGKMLGISLVMVCAAILVGLLASRIAAKLGLDLRGDVFKKVVSFSSAELDRFSTASLITRSTNDIQQVQMVVVMLLRIVIYAPIVGIGGVMKVAATHTGMGWIIALAVGIIVLLVVTLMAIAMPKFQKMQTLIDRLNLVAREILTGLPVIRAFSREQHEEKRFDLANLDLKKTQLFTNRVMTFMMPAMMLVMNGISVLIVWNGA